jgi:DNA primase
VNDKNLPFEEARTHEENAKTAAAAEYDDQTFALLFRDELQEREVARVLMEHGQKKWDESKTVAEFILSELPDEDLFQSDVVLKFIHACRHQLQTHHSIDKNIFVYHPDPALSILAVSLLHFPYEESYRWKSEFSQSTGYQKELFQQDYKSFLRTISRDHHEELSSYLKTQKDTTHEEVESAVNYLKLRKVRKLLLQNQSDMEKALPDQQSTLFLTHQHLKQMEMDLTKKLGTVVLR